MASRIDSSRVTCLAETFSHRSYHRQHALEALLLHPQEVASIESDLGALRGRAYQQVSPLHPGSTDLDQRDPHYWHLLIWDHKSNSLAGAQRLRFSRLNPTESLSSTSYLEHCYPGLDGALSNAGYSYIELGRVFVGQEHQHEMRILPALIRSTVMLMQDTGHDWTLGMLSYNHLKQNKQSVHRFLSRIQNDPFNINLPIVQPRHSFFGLSENDIDEAVLQRDADCHTYRSIEQSIQQDDQHFQIPRLAALYDYVCKSKVAGVSVAKDFNQIIEILMAGSLSAAPPLLRHQGLKLDRRPVWQCGS